MSGEGIAHDLSLPGTDPLALAPDFPRAMLPWYKRALPIMGPDLTRGVDDTAHRHMMDAYYRVPRATMRRLPAQSALQVFFPESEQWAPMVLDVDDPKNVHVVPITGDPLLRRKIRSAREVFRAPRVASFDARDVMAPRLDQMIVCFDEEGGAIGSVVAIQEEGEKGNMLTVIPHEDALRRIGASVFRRRSNKDLGRLFRLSDQLLGPQSEFAQETGHQDTIEHHLVLENALQITYLLNRFKGNRRALRALYTICGSPVTESLVSFVETTEDAARIAAVVRDNPPWLLDLCRAYSTLGHDTITAGDLKKLIYERPLESHVYHLGYDLIKTALLNRDDPGFREDFFNASMAALHDVLNCLHEIDLPARIPKEKDMHGPLTEFTLQRAGDMVALAVVIPYTEELMRLRLGNLPPGEMEQATKFFYSVVGPALNANANRATGDTERQAAVIEDIFIQLAAQGRWKKGDVFVDLGSSDRERIGKGHAVFLRQLAAPSKIIAVDAIAHEYPDESDVLAVQMALEDPDLPMIHARHLGKQEIVPVDAAMMMWSVLNDIGPNKLQDVMNNVAKMLRKRENDKPGGTLIIEVPMGYVEELQQKADALGQAAFPAAELHYPLANGTTVDKPLSIVHAYEMLVRAMRAGLEPLNLPPGKGPINVVCLYDTKAGKKRAFFVFEHVRDPESTLDQLVAVGRAENRCWAA